MSVAARPSGVPRQRGSRVHLTEAASSAGKTTGPGTEPAVSRPESAGNRGSGRRFGLLLLTLAFLAVACAASVAIGARPVAPGTVWEAFTAFDPANGDHAVVHSRVPRTVLGLVTGAALGLAGAAMQGVARNPLADPGILGVNAGAAFAVVLGIYIFGVTNLNGYIWFALAGAAGAAVVVYLVASLGREGATPVKLALAGAALSAGLMSLLSAVLVSSQQTLDTFRFWQVGSVSGRNWDTIVAVLPFLAAGALISVFAGRALNGLSLGDDVARGLGQRVGLTRGITALGVVLLCGAATAAAGPIAFIGLVIPHVVRSFTGPDYRWILPFSMLLAPALLVTADVVGRVLLPPGEIPVGVTTAVIGAPVFIWLVRRRKLAEL
ncbi:iron ABC transporter permease [Arthrobacter sp. zg-Y1110]|uniref:FecCD family ABC transporter permease n=1 Tax=Arthrobacter sp. zg-Y1110 TaxID=2886932 RepID=UPI001D14EAAF|nr:iron chelate uptake ABC transporter family permease subunit [Arthrobacter sp. zg-Y1110]MCC3289974.1 iron chelate uptake ABC transporter family permease subunit [Arthrobacter sp. zg-Y1110]UWX84621.1 iron chelate uptake ABC transporter family permease subunit [Arthrobacter sp. zg-Y1110]